MIYGLKRRVSILSEEWTGIARFQILRTRFLEGHKWSNGKTFENPKDIQTRQKNGVKLESDFHSNKRKTQVAEWAEEGAQQQSSTPQQRNPRGIDRWPRLLQVIAETVVWNWKRDVAPAVPCIEKDDSRAKPQAIATSIDGSAEQSDSENTRACGKVKRYGPHCRKNVCGKLTLWLGTQANLCSRNCEDTRSQSRRG